MERVCWTIEFLLFSQTSRFSSDDILVSIRGVDGWDCRCQWLALVLIELVLVMKPRKVVSRRYGPVEKKIRAHRDIRSLSWSDVYSRGCSCFSCMDH